MMDIQTDKQIDIDRQTDYPRPRLSIDRHTMDGWIFRKTNR